MTIACWQHAMHSRTTRIYQLCMTCAVGLYLALAIWMPFALAQKAANTSLGQPQGYGVDSSSIPTGHVSQLGEAHLERLYSSLDALRRLSCTVRHCQETVPTMSTSFLRPVCCIANRLSAIVDSVLRQVSCYVVRVAQRRSSEVDVSQHHRRPHVRTL